MAVVWDREKSASNIAKHGVRLAEAVPVLEDPLGITVVADESDPSEQRFVTVGASALGRILVVVYTWRDEDNEDLRFQQGQAGSGTADATR